MTNSKALKIQTHGGINNKSQSQTMQPPFVKQAVNLDFADNGEIRKRQDYEKIISGTNCHSVFKADDETLYYVDNGTLKKYNLTTNTGTTVKTGVGNDALSYTVSAGRIYYSNAVVNGCIVDGVYRSWGVARPPKQPDISVSSVGGMFAGRYFVAITWLRAGEESGTGQAVEIDVSENGGIVCTNFPTPPADVDGLAVYVSAVNGKELFLFGEYRADVSTVTVIKHDSGILLETQFGNQPQNFSCLAARFGRIYGAKGNRVYYSEALNPGLFMPNNYLSFVGDVRLIVAVKSALYVVADKTYRIGSVDVDDALTITEILPVSGCGAMSKDPAQTMAVWMSDKGYVTATEDGVSFLAYDWIAVDKYESGAITIMVMDGFKKIIGSFKRLLFS